MGRCRSSRSPCRCTRRSLRRSRSSPRANPRARSASRRPDVRAIGVDVGGTFTDLVSVGADGVDETRKVLSTPEDQSRGVEAALTALGAEPAKVDRVAHGTTVVTNALLERRGAHVVLCATAGFTDLLELRRQERAALYDLARHHPAPLAAPADVVGVAERMRPEGVGLALTDAAIADTVAAVRARNPESVALAFLHAYAHPAHEAALATALRAALPDIEVVPSHEVLPEIREYERTSTTVAEAYVRPLVARYLRRLGDALRNGGYPAPGVVTSAGGVLPATEAARHGAALALSGPAGGVTGAALAARAAGFDLALSIDIGGTSADVGLIEGGEPLVEPGGEVAGVPIALPRVLVDTVSAGGGSLAWRDDGGALRVGPRSAGARPGPVAFGRGGTEPTVTDAHLALGTIHAARFTGGVQLDIPAARAAITRLAASLGATPERTAQAIISTADAEMARALRRVSVERGVDPRRAVLVAFGGGGPLHACALADRLGMKHVLVPPWAGVLSAFGLAIAAERREAIASVMTTTDALDAEAMATHLTALAARVQDPEPGAARRWWMRARYVGQGHELEVPVTPGDDGAQLAARFAERHQQHYGFVLDARVECVSCRHAAIGAARRADFARRGPSTWDPQRLEDDGGPVEAVVRGPASIALPDATLYVAPGWTARALPTGGWLVERA
ncbi:MAG: hydantoinase/oxoprolinase family protein [Gemmatimonadetes bacterium]|nr:hydantoinase/oxoprolinase family protein [Gemmatimonadota bacterium]